MVTPPSGERGELVAPTEAFAPDVARQISFAHEVEAVRKDMVAELPDLSAYLNHRGQTTEGLDGHVEEGLSVNPQFLEWCDTVGHGLPDRLDFRLSPLMRIGRENSRRKVFFGNVGLTWFRDHGHREVVPVAVTPAVGPGGTVETEYYHKMLHEVAMYQHLGRLGVPTLEVIALLTHPDDRETPAFMVTRFKNFDTLNNVMWERLSPEDRQHKIIGGLSILASLHARLLFLGDAHFRNLVTNEVRGDFTVIDPEYAVSVSQLVHPSNDMGAKRLGQLMGKELREFSEDFDAHVTRYLPSKERPANDLERFDLHMREIYTPYYNLLVHSEAPHRPLLLQVLNDVIQQKAKQASGEW